MSDPTFVDRLSPAARERFAAMGIRRTVAAGTHILLEGDLGSRIWAIHSGLVKVSVIHRDGMEVVPALRGAGDLVGELAVLDDKPHSASVVTLLPTEVQTVAATEFLSFLRSDPDAAMALTRSIAARLRESDELRVGQAAEDVAHRLARCLVDLAAAHSPSADDRAPGDSLVIELPLTQQDLAGIVGASRDAVAKTLQGWRDQGLVRTSRRRIELVDADTLVRRHRL